MPLNEQQKADRRAWYAANKKDYNKRQRELYHLRKQNPDWWARRRERDKEYRIANKEKANERTKAWQRKHPEVAQRRRYKARYGISYEEFLAMVASCNGYCPCCTRPFDKAKHRPCLDHDHETNVVRGVLCHSCNAAEGLLTTSENALRLYHIMVKHEAARQGLS